MRPTSILLALIVVLGFVSEAGAYQALPGRDFTISIAGSKFGFADEIDGWCQFSFVYCGPFGTHDIPFGATSTQRLVGFCLIVVGLVALVAVLSVRWRRKWAM